MPQATRIDSIVVAEERQRREFDPRKIEELANDIRKNGLIQPIVLRNDGMTLAAGERRLRALRTIDVPIYCGGFVYQPGYAPTITLHDCSPLELEEIELSENLVRQNLTWQEEADAIARLHRLRQSQRGTSQTRSDTCEELKASGAIQATIGKVSDSLILSEHLKDPDVAKARNSQEALNIVKKRLTAEFTAALAKKTENNSQHILHCSDFTREFTQINSGVFDCIIADPPYGIDIHKHKAMSGVNSGNTHTYDDSWESAQSLYTLLAWEGYRICRDNAHIYLFVDFSHYSEVSDLLSCAGWKVWPRPIVWVKPGGGMLGDSLHGPRRSYELILFASKGNKPVKVVLNDTIIESQDQKMLNQHSAAKPVGLYENLLVRSCLPGDSVLDPCCGSGPIFPAANRTKVIATGFEINPDFYNVAKLRLSEDKAGI